VKPPRLGEGSAVRAPTLHRIPWHLPYNWGKSPKNLRKCARLINAERDSFRRLAHRGRWPPLACWPLPPLAFASGDGVNPGQRKYLPSCRTRSSPHQLTLSQNSQSGLLCGRQTVKHPGPRLSACYLRSGGTSSKAKTLVVTPIASGHGCGHRTSARGTHNRSRGGWAAYIAGLRSWRTDHFLFRRGPNFLYNLIVWGDQLSRVSRATPR